MRARASVTGLTIAPRRLRCRQCRRCRRQVRKRQAHQYVLGRRSPVRVNLVVLTLRRSFPVFPREADYFSTGWHVSNVPRGDIAGYDSATIPAQNCCFCAVASISYLRTNSSFPSPPMRNMQMAAGTVVMLVPSRTGMGQTDAVTRSAVLHNQQSVEQAERDCRHDEHIHRSDPIRMIAQKRLPTLRRRFSSFDHIFGNARLSDINTELEQLSVDPWRSPQWIGNAHLADKLAYLWRYGWSAATAPRLPTPVRSEPGTVPFYDGLRLHNRQSV